jgi:hypothetical protein
MALLRPSSELVKTTLLALTFAWAVYMFVWKEQIAPSLQGPKLEISSAIEMAGNADSGLVRLVIKTKNTGQPPITLLHDNWALYKLVRIKTGTENQFFNRLDSFPEAGNGNANI